MQQLRIAGAKGSFDRTAKLRWVVQMRAALILIYGAKSSLILKFEKWRIEFAKGVPDDLFRARVAEAESLLQYLQCPGSSGSPVPISRASLTPSTREVFIIHGHDELNWRRLSALLRDKFQLEPNIIATRAGQSQSIIDKFETNASRCAFAFALFTPDDVVEKDDTRYHQGRPNVIFETGWFVGRLGKRRVLLLLKDGTKIHSDLDGLNRVQFRDNIEDKYLEIERELIAAGFSGGPV